MSRKSVEEQHSDTAEVAAGYRAVACREYPGSSIGSDYLAKHFIRTSHKFLLRFGFIRNLGIKKSRRFTPGGFEYVLARTAYFDRQLLHAVEAGATQVVILGAGFDTRAYRFAEQCSGCRVIELDIATTQHRKQQRLQQAQIASPSNLTFAPINFNLDSIAEVLGQAGFDSAAQTIFLWEGVSMYLEREAVESTLRFVSQCENKESLLVFDYIASIPDADVDKYYGIRTWLETWAKFRQAEPFKFTLADSQLAAYLDEMGLGVISHLDEKDIEEHYLPNESYENLGKLAGWFRFVTAKG